MNLLWETKEILKRNKKSLDDIEWIGNGVYTIPIEDFIKVADKEYNSGYGLEEVCETLLVVGKDFWLERNTYDGSEWWEFKSLPKKPSKVLNNANVVIWER